LRQIHAVEYWFTNSQMLYPLIFSLATAAVSLSARVVMFLFSPRHFKKWRVVLLNLSAGTFIGLVLFDLLPEAFESNPETTPLWILTGILIFLITEKFLLGYHRQHHHTSKESTGTIKFSKPTGMLVLVGDGIHNFLDGVAIAVAFAVSVPAGIAASVSVLLHEIPQEIGDVMVLMLSGFSKAKAFFWNFIFALTTVIGAVLTTMFLSSIESFLPPLIALIAGGFLYIAMTDLIPETKEVTGIKSALGHFVALFLGVLVIFASRLILPE